MMPQPFKLIIAGGRSYADRDTMVREVNKVWAEALPNRALIVISGMARGADSMAHSIAVSSGVAVQKFPADWDKFGKSAGYRRNVQMAEIADGLLAFWDGKSRGTKHMIDIATERGLFVRVITY